MPLTLCRISQNEKKRPQVEKYTTCGLFAFTGQIRRHIVLFLTSGAYMQPINADAIIVHNGYCKGFVSNALHSTFAVALVAMPGHTGFVNEFTGAAAFATSNYIRHIHTPPTLCR